MLCREIYGVDCDREVVPPTWFHEEHWLEPMGGGKYDWRSPGPQIRAEVPAETLRILAQSSAGPIRQALVGAEQVPEDIVDRLCDDPERGVRVKALGRTRNEARLRRGATLPDPFLRGAVAQNPATPMDLLTQLVADRDPGPREGVTLNERAPAAWIDRMAAEDPDPHVRWAALKKTRSPKIVAEAVRSPEQEVRAGAGWNPLLDEDDMRTLAEDPEPFVRWTLAHCGRLPRDLMARLLHDPDQTVRLMLASNQRLPPELLGQLRHDEASVVRWSAETAWHVRGLDRPPALNPRAEPRPKASWSAPLVAATRLFRGSGRPGEPGGGEEGRGR